MDTNGFIITENNRIPKRTILHRFSQQAQFWSEKSDFTVKEDLLIPHFYGVGCMKSVSQIRTLFSPWIFYYRARHTIFGLYHWHKTFTFWILNKRLIIIFSFLYSNLHKQTNLLSIFNCNLLFIISPRSAICTWYNTRVQQSITAFVISFFLPRLSVFRITHLWISTAKKISGSIQQWEIYSCSRNSCDKSSPPATPI
jgi:hypothetical protein